LPLSQGTGGGASTAAKPTITTYGPTIVATAQQFGVDPALSLGVARAESGISAATATEVVLNPRAVSPNGTSFGLFQITNATGKEQLQEVAPHQTYNPFNPSQNIRLGIHYLKELSATFSANTVLHQGLSTTAGANEHDVRRLAVAAYNAGPGRVARAQEMVRAQGGNPAHYGDIEPYLPRETQGYVRRVERYAAEFRGAHVT
jgi:soluble lytic murein transglycosylase-like protein